MPYGKLGKVGVVHPATGGTGVIEFHRNLHPDIGVYSIPVPFDEVSPAGLKTMSERAIDAMEIFRRYNQMDLVFFSCTSGSLIGGEGYDRKMSEALQAASGARGATTTTTCVLEALRAVGAKRLTVATPYPDDVNLKEKLYLEHEGFAVDRIAGLQHRDPKMMPKTEPEEVYRLVKSIWDGTSDTLFISCTGLSVLSIIEDLEKELGVPVITSNQASIWGVGKFLGKHGENCGHLGQLFRK